MTETIESYQLTKPGTRNELRFAAKQLKRSGTAYWWEEVNGKPKDHPDKQWTLWIHVRVPRKDAGHRISPVTRGALQCQVPGCHRLLKARGLCAAHLESFYRHSHVSDKDLASDVEAMDLTGKT